MQLLIIFFYNSLFYCCTSTLFFIKTVDSDAESEISFGRVSPVSSVHTSDLSSFDDVISLSSDDENGEKKTLPLKEGKLLLILSINIFKDELCIEYLKFLYMIYY